MPYCPYCGALVADDATTCRNCGASLHAQQHGLSQSPQSVQTTPIPSAPQYPQYPQGGGGTRNYVIMGVVSAILSLLVVPEIFGSVAIILGAYSWKKEQGNRGLYIVILGIVCLLIGVYFTSEFALIDLLPTS
jgi:hypothetical protein